MYIDINSGLELAMNVGLYVWTVNHKYTRKLFRNSHLSALFTVLERNYSFHNFRFGDWVSCQVPRKMSA